MVGRLAGPGRSSGPQDVLHHRQASHLAPDTRVRWSMMRYHVMTVQGLNTGSMLLWAGASGFAPVTLPKRHLKQGEEVTSPPCPHFQLGCPGHRAQDFTLKGHQLLSLHYNAHFCALTLISHCILSLHCFKDLMGHLGVKSPALSRVAERPGQAMTFKLHCFDKSGNACKVTLMLQL